MRSHFRKCFPRQEGIHTLLATWLQAGVCYDLQESPEELNVTWLSCLTTNFSSRAFLLLQTVFSCTYACIVMVSTILWKKKLGSSRSVAQAVCPAAHTDQQHSLQPPLLQFSFFIFFYLFFLVMKQHSIGFATKSTPREAPTYPRSFTIASFKWIYVSGKMP